MQRGTLDRILNRERTLRTGESQRKSGVQVVMYLGERYAVPAPALNLQLFYISKIKFILKN